MDDESFDSMALMQEVPLKARIGEISAQLTERSRELIPESRGSKEVVIYQLSLVHHRTAEQQYSVVVLVRVSAFEQQSRRCCLVCQSVGLWTVENRSERSTQLRQNFMKEVASKLSTIWRNVSVIHKTH